MEKHAIKKAERQMGIQKKEQIDILFDLIFLPDQKYVDILFYGTVSSINPTPFIKISDVKSL